MLLWNPWGILGLAAVVISTAFAWLVYSAGPRRPVNVWLAVLLFLEGLLVTTCDDGIGLFVTEANHYYGTAAVHVTIHLALPFVYLIFLGKALETPLVRPLQNRWAVPLLLCLMAVAEISRFLYPDEFIAGLARPWFAPWGVIPGPAFLLVLRLSGIVSVFGLVATLDAWRRARSDAVRRRAKAYAAAFAFHDLYWAILLLVLVPHTQFYDSVLWGIVFTQSMPALTIAFVGLLGYGFLKTQMLDIDLKIRWTLRRGTVAALFVAAFFFVSELAAQTFADRTGSAVAGLGAAAVLVFFLAPLQRLADRLADQAMPQVRDTAEYRTVRKRQVYRAAVESALEDGQITDKERGMLATLASELALNPREALDVERGAVRALRVPARQQA